MNDEAVAYSFSLSQRGVGDEWYDVEDLDGVFMGVDSVGGDGHRREKIITMFTSGELCRETLRGEPVAVPVIVCNGKGLVTPVNLAAALCMDVPERDVYLIEDRPTRSLAGRARVAGIRGILSTSQAQHLLALDVKPIKETSLAGEGRRTPEKKQSRPMRQAVVSLPVPSVMPERSEGQGRVIGFFSGRGGVGKSTVSLMTAFLAQKRGFKIALVDLDMQFGDMGFLAGRESASRIQRLPLEQLCTSSSVPSLAEDALSLVLAPSRPEQAEQLAPSIPWLLKELSAQRDLIVINTGSFWADIHARAIQCCDHLALLTDQRATSIEACKQAAELCSRLQVPQARLLFLLNGCGRHAALTPQDVGLALGGVEVTGLADGGTLVDELLALGCPFELLESGNAFIASLESFLDILIGQRPPFASLGSAPHDMGQKTALGTGTKSGLGTKVFDFAALRGIFRGAHGVAS
jgi:pilus assembly protein CpaE